MENQEASRSGGDQRLWMIGANASILLGGLGLGGLFLGEILRGAPRFGPVGVPLLLGCVAIVLWAAFHAVQGLIHSFNGGVALYTRGDYLYVHAPFERKVALREIVDVEVTSFRSWPFTFTLLRILKRDGTNLSIRPFYIDRNPQNARSKILALVEKSV